MTGDVDDVGDVGDVDDVDASIGFIGLGSMGGALVTALAAAGRSPLVFDLDADKVAAAVASGAVAAADAADVGARSDIVGICVANDHQVRSVLASGLLESLRPGAVISLHSTLLPETVRWVAEVAAPFRIGVVEAPVTGGPAAAAEGRVTFLLAGEPEHVGAIEPLVAACGLARVDAGPFGSANLLKLCVNLQTYVTHLAIAEAASLARSVGVPIEKLEAAMSANGQLGEMSASYIVLQEFSEEVLDDPGIIAIREPLVAIIRKDIELMRSVATDADAEVPAIGLASERLVETYRMPGRRRFPPPADA